MTYFAENVGKDASDSSDVRNTASDAGKIEIVSQQPQCSSREMIAALMTPKQKDQPTATVSMPKIQKVTSLLRYNEKTRGSYAPDDEKFSRLYDPKMVSFGPIHHGKPRYQEAEMFKQDWARKFIKNSGQGADVMHRRIEEKISALRKCFQDEVVEVYSDQKLAWILFVDGCAILHYIDCSEQRKFEELDTNINQAAFAERDMFLLENQVPFQVLELLMGPGKEVETRKNANKFIQKTLLVKDLKPQEGSTDAGGTIGDGAPTHLLELLRKRLLGPPIDAQPNDVEVKKDWQSYRNVSELKASGIYFKKSKSRLLTGIKFTPRCFWGDLEIPPITVDDSTGPIFMNLIAYETCPDFHNDFAVTSYVWFLDSLIDHAEDVKELRKTFILSNCLGSDEEVATLFNELATDLVPNYKLHMNVANEIQEHYGNRWKRELSEIYFTHFSSPWSAIAFFAATAAFVLTWIQTQFTIFPRSTPK